MTMWATIVAALILNGAVITATPLDNVNRAIGDVCKGAAGSGSCKSVPNCEQRCIPTVFLY